MPEIARIEAHGRHIVLNHKVDDLLAERDAGQFDAVFVAIGAHVGKHVDIPARDAVGFWMPWPCCASRDRQQRRCSDVGSWFMAAAIRLWTPPALPTPGAEETLIVYRRDRAHMPAHEFEADEAIAEGMKIKWLTTIKEIVGPTLRSSGWHSTTRAGRSRPANSRRYEADAVVLALGQDSDSDFLARCRESSSSGRTVVVDRHMMTGHPGFSPAATWSRPSAPLRSPSGTARRRHATSMRGCVARAMTSRPPRHW